MGSKQGNLYNKLIALVLWLSGVSYANVNGTEYKVGVENGDRSGNRDENGNRIEKGRPAWEEKAW